MLERITKDEWQHIDCGSAPTYYGYSARPNILDHVFTNDAGLRRIKSAEVGEDVGSDHRPIVVKIQGKKEKVSGWKEIRTTNNHQIKQDMESWAKKNVYLEPNSTSEIDMNVGLVTACLQETKKNNTTTKMIRTRNGIMLSTNSTNLLKEMRRLAQMRRRRDDAETRTQHNKIKKDLRKRLKESLGTYERANGKKGKGQYPVTVNKRRRHPGKQRNSDRRDTQKTLRQNLLTTRRGRILGRMVQRGRKIH